MKHAGAAAFVRRPFLKIGKVSCLKRDFGEENSSLDRTFWEIDFRWIDVVWWMLEVGYVGAGHVETRCVSARYVGTDT